MKKPLTNLADLLDWYHNIEASPEVFSSVDTIFNNDDGAYWELYSRDASVLAMAKQDLSSRFYGAEVEIKIIDISWVESLERKKNQWKDYCECVGINGK